MAAGSDDGRHRRDHAAEHAHGRLAERRRIALALALTTLILVAEVVGGVLSRSLALLSDAGHMLSDVAAQLLSLAALVVAARPSDRRRTYGYYRIEILAALANGVALFALSGWILWSAWHRLRTTPEPIHTGLMLSVAVAGLGANLLGAWILHGAESLNLRGAYLHVLQDTLSSVAVIVGGTVMAVLHGGWIIDPILSIGIGAFVNYGAYKLVRDAVDVLLEAVPLGIDLDQVSCALHRHPHVVAVHDLHLWTITSGIYALSAHLVVDDVNLARNDVLLSDVNEMLLRDYRISHTTIQVETRSYEHVGFTCAHEQRPDEGSA
jgi:cobalt-zinc-cadmium efflux system protein